MAPRITRVLPLGAEVTSDVPQGPTAGGQLVWIYGGGFNLQRGAARAVSVRFGGVEAEEVRSLSVSLLEVVTPASTLPIVVDGATGQYVQSGEGFVDVRVANLDEAGEEVPGDAVVAADAYEYRRPYLDDVRGETAVDAVTRALVEDLTRKIVANVAPSSPSVDYAEPDAQLPAIAVIGPTLVQSPMFEETGPSNTRAGEDELGAQYRGASVVDLQYSLLGYVDDEHGGKAVAMRLLNLLYKRVDRSPGLVVQLGEETYRFQVHRPPGAGFAMIDAPSVSNLHQFQGTVVVRGVPIVGDAFAGTDVFETYPRVKHVLVRAR